MKVVGIILFVALAFLVTWLVVDTVIYAVKRVKEKKANEKKENINDTTDIK